MSTPSVYWRADEETTVSLVSETPPIADAASGAPGADRHRRPPSWITQRRSARLAVLGVCLLAAAALGVALIAGGSGEPSLQTSAVDRAPAPVVDPRTELGRQRPSASTKGTPQSRGPRSRESAPGDAESAGEVDPKPITESPTMPSPVPTPAPSPPVASRTVARPAEPTPAKQSSTSDFSFGSHESAAGP